MINISKNNLIIISGLPGSGKSTLMLNKNLRSKILKKIGEKESVFKLGGEKEYHKILNDGNITNLFYHYGIYLEKFFFKRSKFKNIKKLIEQFKTTVVVICVCERLDLFERYKKREQSRKRGISIKTINPRFLYNICKMYFDYKSKKRVLKYYEHWIDYVSRYSVSYILVNTSKQVMYPIDYRKVKADLKNII